MASRRVPRCHASVAARPAAAWMRASPGGEEPSLLRPAQAPIGPVESTSSAPPSARARVGQKVANACTRRPRQDGSALGNERKPISGEGSGPGECVAGSSAPRVGRGARGGFQPGLGLLVPLLGQDDVDSPPDNLFHFVFRHPEPAVAWANSVLQPPLGPVAGPTCRRTSPRRCCRLAGRSPRS